MMIIVNATANRTSGSLTILKQFISVLNSVKSNDKYYIFINPSYKAPEISNVVFISINTNKWLDRIMWDSFGIKRWLKRNNVKPDVIISLQNTGVNYNAPQIIYYHQPLPLVPYKWNFFKREERLFYLYNKIYPFFIRQYITDKSHFVVQIQSIKDSFVSKFRVNESSVSVFKPDFNLVDSANIPIIHFNDEIHFLYPATACHYKNHCQIVEALNLLSFSKPKLVKKIRVHFTISPKNDVRLMKLILQLGLTENFIFEGNMPFEKLLSLYKSCNGLLFPSYIETYGLPIVEAASLGLPIIISDVPYSRDVIGDYKGAVFVDPHDTIAWSNEIEKICMSSLYRYTPYLPKGESSWLEFINLVGVIANKNI